MKIAVIGCGRWGINHVRTAHKLIQNDLTVCDFSESAKQKVENISGEIEFVSDIEFIVNNSDIKGVIIATPAETHFAIAKRMMEAGKDVLIEKPITLQSKDAIELENIAKKLNRILMVGHILLYHPAIIKVKELVNSGKIGKLQYIYSNRLNLGALRSEENVLWSFAPHDISVIQYLTETKPVEVTANGAQILQNNIEDTTMTYLIYPNNIHAHIFVSWLHPFKEQRLVVIGDLGMIVFEDSLTENKLKFFKKGFQKVDGQIEKFDSPFEVIDFKPAQPLEEEQKHFMDCIENREEPLTNGKHAIEVLEILERASSSMKN